MSVESWCLFGVMVLGLIHVAAASFSYKVQVGNAYTVGPRDDDLPPRGLAGRLSRAQRNFLETFAVFVAAVILLEFRGLAGNWLSELGAATYLVGRILYLPLYASGLAWWRSFAWKAATLGLVMVMAAVAIG